MNGMSRLQKGPSGGELDHIKTQRKDHETREMPPQLGVCIPLAEDMQWDHPVPNGNN